MDIDSTFSKICSKNEAMICQLHSKEISSICTLSSKKENLFVPLCMKCIIEDKAQKYQDCIMYPKEFLEQLNKQLSVQQTEQQQLKGNNKDSQKESFNQIQEYFLIKIKELQLISEKAMKLKEIFISDFEILQSMMKNEKNWQGNVLKRTRIHEFLQNMSDSDNFDDLLESLNGFQDNLTNENTAFPLEFQQQLDSTIEEQIFSFTHSQIQENELNEIEKLVFQLKQKLKIEKIQSSTACDDNTDFEFSTTEKAPLIDIQNQTIAIQNFSPLVHHEQSFCVINPILKNETISFWGIQILKICNWIGVGVCSSEVLKKEDYGFEYSKIGHGSYMISSNGYTWNSDDSYQQNHREFNTGDIIYIQFNPIEQNLKFKIGKSTEIIQINIQNSNIRHFNPCVNLKSTGDQVQIMNIRNIFF